MFCNAVNVSSITHFATDDILTAPEVASRLRCSKAQVYKLILGLVPGVSPLPALSLGRRRVVRRSTLEEWTRQNERSASDAMISSSLKKYAADA